MNWQYVYVGFAIISLWGECIYIYIYIYIYIVSLTWTYIWEVWKNSPVLPKQSQMGKTIQKENYTHGGRYNCFGTTHPPKCKIRCQGKSNKLGLFILDSIKPRRMNTYLVWRYTLFRSGPPIFPFGFSFKYIISKLSGNRLYKSGLNAIGISIETICTQLTWFCSVQVTSRDA